MNNPTVTTKRLTQAEKQHHPRIAYWLFADGHRIGSVIKEVSAMDHVKWYAYLLDGTPINRNGPHSWPERADTLAFLREIVSGYLGYLVWKHWDRIEVRHRGHILVSYDITDGGLDPQIARKAADSVAALHRSAVAS